MLDRITDSSPHANPEQLAAAARLSAEGRPLTGAQTSSRGNENITTLDFNQGNIYGDAHSSGRSIADANAERNSLTAHFEEKLAANPERLTHFRANMMQFNQRAAEMHLSQSEISGLYSNVDRLLQNRSSGPLSADRRLILAEQIMEHAANPFGINQGLHNSCALNALEVRVFDKNPSAAAALIADVALTGSYRSKDGQTFRINAAPHDTAASEFIYDGTRSHASEIFQVTAANILAEQENIALRSETQGSPNVRFEQRPQSQQNPTGDTLVAYYPHGRAAVVHDRGLYTTSSINAGRLADTFAAITGKTEPGTFIGRDNVITDNSLNITHIASVDDLQRQLAEARAQGKFPLTIFVHTGSEPFWSDAGGADLDGGHVVNITDYVPGNGPDARSYALVDNSWSDQEDHGTNNPIELNALYNAMAPADQSVPYLQGVATRARAGGSPDYGTEIDILRLQASFMLATPEEVGRDFDRTFDANFLAWAGKLSLREQFNLVRKLDLINQYRGS